jgi:cytochrome c oxidase subunit 1
VFALMMLVGATMRMTQAMWLPIPPNHFYELMTLHGAGMVGTSGLAGAAVMWFFLRRYVTLSTGVFLTMLGLSLVGVVLIIGAIAIGRFAAAWTFLYPLPAKPMGVWSTPAAAAFVLGLVFIGVGFLVFYIDCAIAIVKRYGSLIRALGVPQLFSGAIDESHPPTVVAAVMVIIINVLGILAGAVVLVMTLVNLFVPSMVFDALAMKNLIFFFGHVFINATIYMAVIAIYELLPRYTGRPWKISRPFLAAWLAATLMVMAVYPHHLLMDFVMPRWAAVLGQVLSFLSGIPVVCVTAYGALANIHRSNMRWDLPSRLFLLSLFGWVAGIVPAIIDGTIVVNKVMHNTLWVPGHFHFYLVLGLLPMLLGFMFYAVGKKHEHNQGDTAAFWIYAASGLVFCLGFLHAGYSSVPRRFAVHATEWIGFAQISSLAAIVVVLAAVWLAITLLRRLPRVDLAIA